MNRNIVANFAATAWVSILSLALIPVYVRLMGIESYALVALLATLQAFFAPLDAGLSTTINRELALTSGDPSRRKQTADSVRTVEVLYWGAALLFGSSVIIAATLLATHWLNAAALSVTTVSHAFMIAGVLLIFQLPLSLYSGGLLGLQQQVKLNVINIVAATVRAAGAVAALLLVAPNVLVYFAWQAIATAVHTAVVAWFLWRELKGWRSARFDWSELRRLRGFTASVVGIALLGVLLTQVDKIVLSRVLPLAHFGYYTIAASVAAVLYRAVLPVQQAVFPRLAELVGRGDDPAIRRVYHDATQLVTVLIMPAAVVLALFSHDALTLWLRDSEVAEAAAPLLAVLTLGTAINGLLNIPYALQLAHGWTTLPLYTNVVAVVLLVPALVFGSMRFGAIGAAAVWLLLNVAYATIPLTIAHRRLLRGEQARWYIDDVLRPSAAACAVAVCGKLLATTVAPGLVATAVMVVTAAASLVAAACAAPMAARWLRSRYRAGRTTV